MKMMIVDDNKKMRKMIRLFVERGDDEFIECSTGGEAVSAFPEFKPDVVLMDIEMNGMDGFTATEQIYKHDPSARIIFVSSHNTSAFRTKAKLLNARGFVVKEELSDLQLVIESCTVHTPPRQS